MKDVQLLHCICVSPVPVSQLRHAFRHELSGGGADVRHQLRQVHPLAFYRAHALHFSTTVHLRLRGGINRRALGGKCLFTYILSRIAIHFATLPQQISGLHMPLAMHLN